MQTAIRAVYGEQEAIEFTAPWGAAAHRLLSEAVITRAPLSYGGWAWIVNELTVEPSGTEEHQTVDIEVRLMSLGMAAGVELPVLLRP